jgi:hypothetical protein
MKETDPKASREKRSKDPNQSVEKMLKNYPPKQK